MDARRNKVIVEKSHVLVVDDDEAVVRFLDELLSYSGYTVTTKRDGQSALDLYRANPNQFDLVITDQTMPRLTGIEMAQEILRLRPDQLIVLCTGFSEVVSESSALSMGIKKYLPKPVNTSELICILDELIHRKSLK